MKTTGGQNRVFDRSRLYEQLVYVLMWLLVCLFPLVNEGVRSSHGLEFSWSEVFHWWFGMIPFILVFAIHNHFLIPRFLFAGRFRTYVLLTVCLLTLFGIYQFSVMETRREHFRKEIATMPPHDILPDRSSGMPPSIKPDFMPDNRPAPAPGARRHHGGPMVPAPMFLNLFVAFLMLGLNVAIVMMFKYQREQENRKDLENMRLQDELRYLKAQINPHFFMNMLNNIHAMVELDAGKAQDMILELSKLMRYVLYEGDKASVTFAGEVHFLSSYLALMRQRYPDSKVAITLDVPEIPSDSICLPPLLFIAFVENAFKHGISYRRRSEVEISLKESDGMVRFLCRNTKPQTETSEKRVGGVGLENVRRRLDLIYGDNYSLDIEDGEEYSVSLAIPTLNS